MVRMNPFAMLSATLLAGAMVSGCTTPDTKGAAPVQTCLSDPEALLQAHSNSAPDYIACANTANLKAMVANPADLDQARPLGPASGDREALVVKTYEQGLTKPLGQTGTQSQTAGATGGSQ